DKVDLASERLGGVVVSANDEFFAPKENLLKLERPIFIPDKYTDRGKWMDGWETRRKRVPGHDHCVIKLGLAGVIHGIDVGTAFFRGNYPDGCSIDGGIAGAEGAGGAIEWHEILPRAPLLGDTRNLFPISDRRRFTHIRLHIYPDGGVARLRVHGDVVPDWRAAPGDLGDLAALANGALVLASSAKFFGSHQNLIMPGRGRDMGDGWETRRRRGPGYDWLILRLAARGAIGEVEVDTHHFKGNYPDRFSLEVCDAADATLDL